jgi:hypothetical protein
MMCVSLRPIFQQLDVCPMVDQTDQCAELDGKNILNELIFIR